MRPRSPRQRGVVAGATRRAELERLNVGRYQSSEFEEHRSGELVNNVVARPVRRCRRNRCRVARRSPHVDADGRGRRAGVRVVDEPSVLAETIGAVRPGKIVLDLATALAFGGDYFADITTGANAAPCSGKCGHIQRRNQLRLPTNEDSDFTTLLAFVDHGSTELVNLPRRCSGPTTPIPTLPTNTSK